MYTNHHLRPTRRRSVTHQRYVEVYLPAETLSCASIFLFTSYFAMFWKFLGTAGSSIQVPDCRWHTSKRMVLKLQTLCQNNAKRQAPSGQSSFQNVNLRLDFNLIFAGDTVYSVEGKQRCSHLHWLRVYESQPFNTNYSQFLQSAANPTLFIQSGFKCPLFKAGMHQFALLVLEYRAKTIVLIPTDCNVYSNCCRPQSKTFF